ncbi:MAG: methyltransferase domain-containing protein [Campylobacterales bacterium]|nr:methyltransferase domain-containing protein [Campylobacterales bacterium]
MIKHKKEFSRRVKTYEQHAIIQKQIAFELTSLIENLKFNTVVDLGAGSGEIYKHLKTKPSLFIAIDLSEKMCEIHPKEPNIELFNIDFESSELDNILNRQKVDLIISSSSLQWCNDLDKFFEKISHSSSVFAFSIFTANTFKTIFSTTNLEPIIYKKELLIEKLNRYFNVQTLFTKEYKLNFYDKLELFRHIKLTGVSGGEKRLDFKQTKELIQNYPLDFLEFEALFCVATTKNLS